MKLSVIVPVYGVEKYLRKCVDSILSQSFSDLEIILVDDKSLDSSGRMCDEIAETDSRVIVVHREKNGGLSAARNTGLDYASGDYITFVDSDDFLAADTYAENMRIFGQDPSVDVVEFPVWVFYGSPREHYFCPADGGMRDTGNFRHWIARNGFLHSYAWNKIFLASLWDGRRFPDGRYYEDIALIPYLLRDAKKIVGSSAGCYYYCSFNENSITNTPDKLKSRQFLEANSDLFAFLKREAGFSSADLHRLYQELMNGQIVYSCAGGDLLIPIERTALREIMRRSDSAKARLKALSVMLIGEYFFGMYGRLKSRPLYREKR